MKLKTTMWGVLLVGLVLMTGCLCDPPLTKDQCKVTYTLVEPMPQPPDGPMIILSRTGTTMNWHIGGTQQTSSGPAGTVLRNDFIGAKIKIFELVFNDGTTMNPSKIFLTNSAGTVLELKQTTLAPSWYLSAIHLDPSGSQNTGTVPIELMDVNVTGTDPIIPGPLTLNDIQEFRLQVKMP